MRLMEVVVNRVKIIKFRVNNGDGNGTYGCGIEIRADTANLTSRGL